MAETLPCVWCESQHDERHLCDPAKALLDAMVARGRSHDMPAVEFDKPVLGGLLGNDTQLLLQLVVQGAVIDAGGMPRPALVFTGKSAEGRPLPNWVFPGTVENIRSTVRLVQDMANLAIRRAQAGRQR